MRFNFSTAKRGKCLVDVGTDGNGPIATIWFFDKQADPGTSYVASAEMRIKFGNLLTASQSEKIARMAILRFDAFGDFPGRTDVELTGSEWRGELIPLN